MLHLNWKDFLVNIVSEDASIEKAHSNPSNLHSNTEIFSNKNWDKENKES